MPVNATFGVLSMPVFTGKYRWQIPPVNATGQPWLNNMSNSAAYCSQTSIIICNADLHRASN